jgi:N-acetylneuraminic acid mutarotase
VLNIIERYDPTANQWHTVAPMDTERVFSSCAMYNGCLYVAGGYGTSALSSVERYDPTTNMWMNDVAPMNNCRWGVSLYSHIDNYFFTICKILLESGLLFVL